MVNRLRGEVAFPHAGEGCFIQFTVNDIVTLEDEYGVGDYFDAIETGINAASGKIIRTCLNVGLKRRDAEGKRMRVALDFDEVEWPFTEAGMPILDALCLSSVGKPYAEVLKEAVERQEHIRAETAKSGGADDGDPDPTKGSEEPNGSKPSGTASA